MNDDVVRRPAAGPANADGFWIEDAGHRAWLKAEGDRQLAFFSASAQSARGFCQLDHDGTALDVDVQELHATTRMVHAYSLGSLGGHEGAADLVDRGMDYLASYHKDPVHGGYFWALSGAQVHDPRKLAYGHVFVLLAAASAKVAGHPDADVLLNDAAAVLDEHFWEEEAGLFCDEWNRDWTPFSTYRGMNANMHGVEALLAAYEATGERLFLDRAGRILDFFVHKIAPEQGWRLPEHYTDGWQIDRRYAGNHMFRPAGTTPGHALELGRLALQHWDLTGRPANGAPQAARQLIERALADAWLPEGGLAYTLDFDGNIGDGSRFWWPVTEAIGALSALIVLERRSADEVWYRRLWDFANCHFIDHAKGGWFPAIDEAGKPTNSIFAGKPDIYHSLQACLLPLSGRLSRLALAPEG